MNNTDKLLRAFIEAQGFEIEEVESIELSHTIPFMGQTEYDMLHSPTFAGYIISRVQTKDDNHWELHHKVIDYKVTKKVDDDLIRAMDRCVELMYAEYSHVEPEILAAFTKAGWKP